METTINTRLNAIKQHGYLAYEYNPFHNYRITSNTDENGLKENQILYQNHIYDILSNNNVNYIVKDNQKLILQGNNNTYYVEKEGDCINYKIDYIYEAGSIVDLDTDQLNFSLNHPVDIEVQDSYDGSVNLILNDNYNKPRLINSRFSQKGLNYYEVVDRLGDNDTNLYDDNQFDSDTSLYKLWNKIPKITYTGLLYNGELKVGNYVFYFKYADADGNETDFVGESGIVSIFIGNDGDPFSINGGYKNMNANKGIQFHITNIDEAYDYLVIYYTRAYADLQQNRVTSAYRIEKKYTLHSNQTSISIFGIEPTTEVPLTEINKEYFIANKARTQAQCSNRLFLGGVSKPDINYKELSDISLRILPTVYSNDYLIGDMAPDYSDKTGLNGYYNTQNIYKYVGYWPEEIYRFGVVYILEDNTHTSVFNVRGINNITTEGSYTKIPFWKKVDDVEKIRNYINVDEQTQLLSGGKVEELENGRGVVRIGRSLANVKSVLGIKFNVDNDCLDYLKNVLKIKGMIFVRQKRIPNILAQGFATPVDSQSHMPLMYDGSDIKYESFIRGNGGDKERYLTHNLSERLRNVDQEDAKDIKNNSQIALICPEFEQNQPYYNQFFTGSQYVIRNVTQQLNQSTGLDSRIYEVSGYDDNLDTSAGFLNAKIISVTEDVPTVAIEDKIFKLVAGQAEDLRLFDFVGHEDTKNKDAVNVIRGYFGPYLGVKIDSKNVEPLYNKLFNIYIPNYSEGNMKNYFELRYQDDSSYGAISDYIILNEKSSDFSILAYRGDCYICNYTHRNLRNFNDPTCPNNDKILDEDTWAANYKADTPECFDDMNRADVNAVKLGTWTTIKVRSTTNLSIRSADESYVSESYLMGTPRSFYPLSKILNSGENKVAESTATNDGFRSTLSERWYMKLPDVPYYKNYFENRILYSEISINDAFKNGYRVFYSTSFEDYKREYGKIVKLVEWQGDLICVFERAIGFIDVNPQSVMSDNNNQQVYINTRNVLPLEPIILTNDLGSQWEESIIKTPYFIYGVDTRAKKIWKCNGRQVEIISDMNINKFLVENITLGERELDPIIGIRNVKTHYNANKSDVMFTFYDNKEGFEEKAWNICYNELLQKFITFYSWMPSYSANIQNQFWSFDRNTSKYVSKLGICQQYSTNAEGIILENVIMDDNSLGLEHKESQGHILVNDYICYAKFNITGLENVVLPDIGEENNKISIEYSIEPDSFGNYRKCSIINNSTLKVAIDEGKKYSTIEDGDYYTFKYIDVINGNPQFKRNSDGEPLYKFRSKLVDDNDENTYPVFYVNIRATATLTDEAKYLKEFFDIDESVEGQTTVNLGEYDYTVALTTLESITEAYRTIFKRGKHDALCTDFWIHGRAGLIDIKENIKPTRWYNQQHPFEFEFVVNKDPQIQKIFTNLQIISNKAEPESFHFEVVGEGYEFAPDKENMYYRQEAMKELSQHLGYDTLYDLNYIKTVRPNLNNTTDNTYSKWTYGEGFDETLTKRTPKSTLFPQYYYREDTLNELYHFYIKMVYEGSDTFNGSYNGLSGSEIVQDVDLNEYRIQTHIPNLPINRYGRRKGNSHYKEDEWKIQIPSIYYRQKNENWEELPPINLEYMPKNLTDKATSQLSYNVLPEAYQKIYRPKNPKNPTSEEVGKVIDNGYNGQWSDIKETKIRDKYLKVRVRYSGTDLAIISGIITLYNYSYA